MSVSLSTHMSVASSGPQVAPLEAARSAGVKRVPTYAYWGGPNLYLNLTSRCSAGCAFCLRRSSWEVFGTYLHLTPDEEPRGEEVIASILEALGFSGSAEGAGSVGGRGPIAPSPHVALGSLANQRPQEVVFTGLGEPTMRLDVLLEVTRWLSREHLTARLDTNGHGCLINPGRSVAAELAAAGLARVSVSLNAPDASSYETLCRPAFPEAFTAVTDFVRKSVEAGLETTATAVELPQVSVGEVQSLARSLGAAFRVRRYMPPREDK